MLDAGVLQERPVERGLVVVDVDLHVDVDVDVDVDESATHPLR